MSSVADEVRKPDAMKRIPYDRQTGQARDGTLELRNARDVADFILRERARPATDEGDLRCFGKRAEVSNELFTRDGSDLLIGKVGKLVCGCAREEST